MSAEDLALRDAILAVEDPAERMVLLFEQVQRRLGAVGFDGLSATEVLVFCTWDFVNEVDNGGFDQFFANSSGDRAEETLAALRAIGATSSAASISTIIRS